MLMQVRMAVVMEENTPKEQRELARTLRPDPEGRDRGQPGWRPYQGQGVRAEPRAQHPHRPAVRSRATHPDRHCPRRAREPRRRRGQILPKLPQRDHTVPRDLLRLRAVRRGQQDVRADSADCPDDLAEARAALDPDPDQPCDLRGHDLAIRAAAVPGARPPEKPAIDRIIIQPAMPVARTFSSLFKWSGPASPMPTWRE